MSVREAVEDSPSTRERLVFALAIVVAATLAILPFTFLGYSAAGHDLEFHVTSWADMSAAWRQGVAFPRWAALANHGYGEPRFTFYPPMSFMIGSAMSSIVPLRWAVGATVWVMLLLAGALMYRFARSFVAGRYATIAAVAYVLNPYTIMNVYVRSTYAELLTVAVLPLFFLLVYRLYQGEHSAIAPLAIGSAVVCLTDIPAAVVALYAAGLLVVFGAVLQRSVGLLWRGSLAFLLGLGTVAGYLYPGWIERTWIHYGALFHLFRPADHFLLTGQRKPFQLGVWVLAISAFAVLLILFRAWKRQANEDSKAIVGGCCFLGGVAFLLMWAPTSFLWQHLPGLIYVEFPWRWNSVLMLAVVSLLTICIAQSRHPLREAWFWCGLALFMISLMLPVRGYLAPERVNVETLLRNAQTRGYDGFPEYLPNTAPSLILSSTPERARVESNPASAFASVDTWEPEHKRVKFSSAVPTQLTFRLFAYPNWHAYINGQKAESGIAQDGSIQVNVPAGASVVDLRYELGSDFRVGKAISATSLLVLAVVWILGRRGTRAAGK